MYSINPLPKNVLITPDEVTRMFNRQIIDGNIWKSAIQIAEERFVRPVLGTAFYDSLCTQKNVIVTTGNITQLQAFFDDSWGEGKKVLELGQIVNAIELISVTAANATLWNNYLWKFIYEAVYFTALPEVYAQFSDAGVVKNNPSPTFIDSSAQGTSAGIGLNDLKYLKDDVLLQRISIMQDALERFLCENAASYPLYPKKNHVWDEHGRRQNSRKTGFILMYDEDCNDNYYCDTPASAAVTPAPSYRSCSMQLRIVATPNPSNTYTLCNLTTIALEYPEGMTLTVPHLIGKTVSATVYIGNNPINDMTYDILTGTFDNTPNGGFADGNTVTIDYTEVV